MSDSPNPQPPEKSAPTPPPAPPPVPDIRPDPATLKHIEGDSKHVPWNFDAEPPAKEA